MRKRNLVFLILGVTSVALVIAYFVFIRMFYVPVGSMSNTVIPGDSVVGFRSLGGSVKRGQVIVSQYPDDSTYYLHRVVGLPGETIEFRERTVYINGQPLAEQKVLVKTQNYTRPLKELSTQGSGPYRVFYEENADQTPPENAMFGTHMPYKIPAGNYFVMGDNRDDSLDSRYRGPVPAQLVWGTVSLIYFSTDPETGEMRWGRVLKRVN